MLLLIMISIRIGKSVFLYFNPLLLRTYLQIGLSACFLIGPSLYFYIKSGLENYTRIPRLWSYGYGSLILIIVIGGLLYPYEKFPNEWGNLVIPYIIYGNWALFTVMSCYVFWKSKWRFKEKPLLGIVIIGNCAILLAYILSYMNLIRGSYISGSIMYSFILYLSLFMVFKNNRNSSVERYKNRKIGNEYANSMLTKMENIIASSGIYKNPELKISNLAQMLNVSSHLLSQLLNDNLGKSFSSYINEYRINEAAQKIINEPHIKIEEIGYEVGFNSKSAFFTAFKKIKNTTPLKYRETLLSS